VLLKIEILSVVLTLVYMYFAARKKATGWIFGIAASLLSAFLMYRQALVGSAALNIVYALQGIFGYVNWKGAMAYRQPSYRLSWVYHVVWVSACVLFSFLLYRLFIAMGFMEFVYLDIFLATGCILATFLEIRKDTSCWWYWMAFNVAYASLYWWQSYTSGKSLYIYGMLMLGLAVFSFFALKQWEKKPVQDSDLKKDTYGKP
jgi:nicotinamide mononucleotide transporter